jgi:hypothetical protein
MRLWLLVFLASCGPAVQDICMDLSTSLCTRSVECGISGLVERCVPPTVKKCCDYAPCESPLSNVSGEDVEACSNDLLSYSCDQLWDTWPNSCLKLID